MPIRLGFRVMPGIIHYDLVLHNISCAAIDHNIVIFLRDKFHEIREELEDLPANWPGDNKIVYLIERADGLFISATTVYRFIKGDRQWLPQDLLDLVLLDTGSGQLLEWDRDIPFQLPI
jgi:hypothetical protein